jgi:hypothetical protein
VRALFAWCFVGGSAGRGAVGPPVIALVPGWMYAAWRSILRKELGIAP